MKKSLLITILLLLSCLLYSCSNSSDIKNKKYEVIATFIGTIEEITGNNGIVDIEEGDILSSGNSVSVDLSVNPTATFNRGDKVIVGYDGKTMESFPLQINTISIEFVE